MNGKSISYSHFLLYKTHSNALKPYRAIMFHIGVSTKHPPLPEPGQLSEIGIDFIELCLTLEAARRPTAAELLRHPWLVSMQQQLSEHNTTAGSSFGSSFQSSHMTSMRSHGLMPDTEMTPDTEMAAFTTNTGSEKPSRTNSEEAAHVQKYETAQGTAIDPNNVSPRLMCIVTSSSADETCLDVQLSQDGQEQSEQQYEEGQEQYAEGQEQEGDDQSYPSLEPAALEMVMERAEGDDELAESLRTALTIIDDCMNDYGSVPVCRFGESRT